MISSWETRFWTRFRLGMGKIFSKFQINELRVVIFELFLL
jgi:hypothetical protein